MPIIRRIQSFTKKTGLLYTLVGVLVIGLAAYAIYALIDNSQPKQDNDTQSSDVQNNSVTFAAAGDFGADEKFKATLNTIKRHDTDFTLALGDLSYGETKSESGWCNLVESRLGRNYPFFLVEGNHDTGRSGQGAIDDFTECLPAKLETIKGQYGERYYFDYESLARFILITPALIKNQPDPSYAKGGENYRWLSQAIDGARQKNIRWVIVGMHKNCLTMGVKKCEIGTDLEDLLVSKNVDLILQGHEHAYMRTKQLKVDQDCPSINPKTFNAACVSNVSTDEYRAGEGSIIVITGTGGHSLRDINLHSPAKPYFAYWSGHNVNPAHGVTIVKLNDRRLQASFVSNSNQVKDEFSIVR